MKAVARVPPSLRGCASFSPDMGFVQPGSFFEFGLRFRPDPDCLARCARDGWGVFSERQTSPDGIRATQQPHLPPQPDQQANDAALTGELGNYLSNMDANEFGGCLLYTSPSPRD